jgi:hypothetical protein
MEFCVLFLLVKCWAREWLLYSYKWERESYVVDFYTRSRFSVCYCNERFAGWTYIRDVESGVLFG